MELLWTVSELIHIVSLVQLTHLLPAAYTITFLIVSLIFKQVLSPFSSWKCAGSTLSFWFCSEVQKRKTEVKVLVPQQCLTLLTPWTVPYQAPLSVEFSRQEYWSGLPFPSPGDLPDPGIEPGSPALQADSLLSDPPENFAVTTCYITSIIKFSGLFFHLRSEGQIYHGKRDFIQHVKFGEETCIPLKAAVEY